jgi:hypothetical protein
MLPPFSKGGIGGISVMPISENTFGIPYMAINMFITIQKKPPGSNRVPATGRESSLSAYVAAICRRSYASVSGIRRDGSLPYLNNFGDPLIQ